MTRLALVCGLLLILAAPAAAGTISGRLVSGTDPRLDVTYRGVPGKRDFVRVLPHPSGVRVIDRHGIAAGAFCIAVNGHDARCGAPGRERLLVAARTGDNPDIGFTHIGSLILGSGDDLGIAYAASVYGGPGDDEVRGFGDGTLIAGGPGDDEELASFGDQRMDGGPGQDFIVAGLGDDRVEGGPGRDTIVGGRGHDEIAAGPGSDLIRSSDADRDAVRCGPGHDRAYVSRNDRVSGCEVVIYGWPD